jgi:hypothetical protein
MLTKAWELAAAAGGGEEPRAPYFGTPVYEQLDRIEEREDGCARWV